MNTSANSQFDAIESLIMNDGLRIEALDFHPEQDMMLVILNTKVALTQNLSAYPSLKRADKAQLQQYKLIGEGTGVHCRSASTMTGSNIVIDPAGGNTLGNTEVSFTDKSFKRSSAAA